MSILKIVLQIARFIRHKCGKRKQIVMNIASKSYNTKIYILNFSFNFDENILHLLFQSFSIYRPSKRSYWNILFDNQGQSSLFRSWYSLKYFYKIIENLCILLI